MIDFIIVTIIVLIFAYGVLHMVKHFKGNGGCCGSGTFVEKKKLKNVIATKTLIVEGMSCENCKARVIRAINDIDGLAAKVNLKRKMVIVSMQRDVDTEEITAAIEKIGYKVVEVR